MGYTININNINHLKMANTRNEKDSLGTVKVPQNAYHGAFTVRANDNFQISGINCHSIFKDALATVKMSAAKTNGALKLMTKDQEEAIVKACQELIDGKYDNEFILDVFQAGAGTSYNMNSNEIIANRANEILGGKKGNYEHIHPNNHVNMGQSTNDVIPTATRIATLFVLPALLKEISNLENALEEKAKKYKDLIKVGRTHMQDAVPITLGQEFDSYREALKKSKEFIVERSSDLQILGIGGTAVGTGINADPKYKDLMVENLSELTGIKFSSGKNLTEMANNMNSFMNLSGSLRSLATNLMNICHDLKLLSTGPKAGLAELTLPPVQPGSSIMPGKVNPSIPESVEMVAAQVFGNDKTIEICAQKSQLELNVLCPIIMYNLIQSIEILTNGIKTLKERCIEELIVNEDRIKYLFENSLCTATALAPHIGYNETADIVKTALREHSTIKKEFLKRKLMDEKKLEQILK